MIFVSSLEFQAGLCLYVTAPVKAASHFGKAQGDQSGQSQFLGSLEPVGALVFQLTPPSPLPAPLWCVPGRSFRSWEHLSFSLSLSFSSLDA